MADYFFSIVIPTYNRKEQLMQCLDSLVRQSFDRANFEVIVVDDGSTDGTSDTVQKQSFPFRFQYIRIENSGPSAARNTGVQHAKGTYIAFLEDDVAADPRFLEHACTHLQSEPVDMLEGKTVYQTTKQNIRRFEDDRQLSFIPCNLFVKRTAFETIGGYDPHFYDPERNLYFREDADLGFRILDAGLQVSKADDVLVEHPEQFTDLSACFSHVRRYMFDPLLYKKHPKRFRQMIEVKKIFGVTIHRPQHYVALLYLLGLMGLCVQTIIMSDSNVFLSATVVVVSSFLYRYKYQGWRALEVYKIHETIGFFMIPLVYLYSMLRGCSRFKSFGVLI